MTSITIPDVPDSMRRGLESYAINHGLTLESYLRQAIEKLPGAVPKDGAEILALADKYFGRYGDIELDLKP
jgi:hypothetical protein